MVNLMKMVKMMKMVDGGDGDGQDHGDLKAHPVNADKFGISPEKYIFFTRNRTWSEKDTEH